MNNATETVTHHCSCKVCKGAGVTAPARTFAPARNAKEVRTIAHNLVRIAQNPMLRGTLVYVPAAA